jgi:hypothetical protein
VFLAALQGGAAAPQQPQQPAAPPAPEPPLQVPEPTAEQIGTLTDMGFSEAVARKALLLTRCNVEVALEWVLQHMDDPDAETPPTQEQLRQVGRVWIAYVPCAGIPQQSQHLEVL